MKIEVVDDLMMSCDGMKMIFVQKFERWRRKTIKE